MYHLYHFLFPGHMEKLKAVRKFEQETLCWQDCMKQILFLNIQKTTPEVLEVRRKKDKLDAWFINPFALSRHSTLTRKHPRNACRDSKCPTFTIAKEVRFQAGNRVPSSFSASIPLDGRGKLPLFSRYKVTSPTNDQDTLPTVFNHRRPNSAQHRNRLPILPIHRKLEPSIA